MSGPCATLRSKLAFWLVGWDWEGVYGEKMGGISLEMGEMK
jgi:hypothetical protein